MPISTIERLETGLDEAIELYKAEVIDRIVYLGKVYEEIEAGQTFSSGLNDSDQYIRDLSENGGDKASDHVNNLCLLRNAIVEDPSLEHVSRLIDMEMTFLGKLTPVESDYYDEPKSRSLIERAKFADLVIANSNVAQPETAPQSFEELMIEREKLDADFEIEHSALTGFLENLPAKTLRLLAKVYAGKLADLRVRGKTDLQLIYPLKIDEGDQSAPDVLSPGKIDYSKVAAIAIALATSVTHGAIMGAPSAARQKVEPTVAQAPQRTENRQPNISISVPSSAETAPHNSTAKPAAHRIEQPKQAKELPVQKEAKKHSSNSSPSMPKANQETSSTTEKAHQIQEHIKKVNEEIKKKVPEACFNPNVIPKEYTSKVRWEDIVYITNRLLADGYDIQQAAGIVANVVSESGAFPSVEENKIGRFTNIAKLPESVVTNPSIGGGIDQQTPISKELNWAKVLHVSPLTIAGETTIMIAAINSDGNARWLLIHAPTAAEAALIDQNYYERPSKNTLARSAEAAQLVLELERQGALQQTICK